jgi:hypothetical protein
MEKGIFVNWRMELDNHISDVARKADCLLRAGAYYIVFGYTEATNGQWGAIHVAESWSLLPTEAMPIHKLNQHRLANGWATLDQMKSEIRRQTSKLPIIGHIEKQDGTFEDIPFNGMV